MPAVRDALHVKLIERRSAAGPSIERVFAKVGEELSRLGASVEHVKLPFGDGLANVLKNLFSFRPAAADVYHVTGHSTYIALVLPREKTVVTFHDLVLLELRKGLRGYILRKLYYEWPAKRAAAVTAISNATARQLAAAANIDVGKIHVVGNPLLIETEAERPAFGGPPYRILQVGTAPNKNVGKLVEAVESLPCVLHIVGPLKEDLRCHLEQRNVRFEHDERLSDTEMLQAYKQADIVSLCSTAEGFGLPIIEAQAVGVPVVTSDISPMREVAGEGAILVDPTDASAIRQAFQEIASNSRLRDSLFERGRANLSRFDAHAVAERYLDVYDSVLTAEVSA